MKQQTLKIVLNFLIVLGILVSINIISSFVHESIDLTEDKRFTITKPSERIIESLDEPVYIKVLLEGKFPAGFKRLRNATEEMIKDIQDINGNIQFDFEDPNEGSVQERNETYKKLKERNILPMRLTYMEDDQRVERLTYPYAIMNLGARNVVINLLEEQVMGVDEEVTINNSISLLEYKFVNALRNLIRTEKKNILFVDGHGELPIPNTYRLEGELRRFHNTDRIILDSVVQIPKEIDLIIVAGPKSTYSLKDQFKLDQYLMNGGNAIWMIDQLEVKMDSIAKYGVYNPPQSQHGLDDLFFKYGIRFEPNLLMDYQCTEIPQVIGTVGERPQIELRPWFFHPLLLPQSEHPIVKNIGQVNLYFPNTVTALETKFPLEKTVLLETSSRSRFKYIPMELTTRLTEVDVDPKLFNKEAQPVAILLEGKFESLFKNRLTNDFKRVLEQIGSEFSEESPEIKQLFISDSDLIKNRVDLNSNRTSEIGNNRWTGKTYKGNQMFILNAIEYMIDPDNVLSARSKEVKLRLLDAARTKTEKSKWQFINLGVPLLLLGLFGIGFTFWRRRKYAA